MFGRKRKLGRIKLTPHLLENARGNPDATYMYDGETLVLWSKDHTQKILSVYVKRGAPRCDDLELEVDIVVHGIVLPLKDHVPEMMEAHNARIREVEARFA